MVNEINKIQLKLGGLSCSFCASTLEKAFDKKEGVKKAKVSLAHMKFWLSTNLRN